MHGVPATCTAAQGHVQTALCTSHQACGTTAPGLVKALKTSPGSKRAASNDARMAGLTNST
eukprot:3057957-Lingulodinium_polyedra.AAC.1